MAQEAMRRIGERYAIEKTLWGKPAAQRRQARQEQAAQKLVEFKQWIDRTPALTPSKSELGKAGIYSHKGSWRRWHATQPPGESRWTTTRPIGSCEQWP
jgi:hypothetical protein